MAGPIDRKIIETVFRNQYAGSADVQKYIADINKLAAAQKQLGAKQKEGAEIARMVGRDLFYVSVQIAAVGAALKLLIQGNIEFERSLTIVSTMLNRTGMEWMPRYRDEILNVSVQTGKAATDISKALFEVLSAAIPPAQAMQVIRTASDLATAGFINVEQAASPLITVMNVYGKTANELTNVSDKMFAAYDRGVFTIQDLSANLGNVASTAKLAGVTFEELLAMMMLLTRSGIKLDEAVTSITGLLKLFNNPTVEATKALRQYKRAYQDLTLELHPAYVRQQGMINVLKELNKLMPQEVNNMIGRAEGIKAASVLLPNLVGYEKDLLYVTEASNKTEVARQKALADTGVQMEQLMQALEKMRIEYGKLVLPISPLVKLVDIFNNFNDVTKTLVSSILQGTIVVGGGASAFAILAGALKTLGASAPILLTVAKGLGLVGLGLLAFGGGMEAAMKVWEESAEGSKLRAFLDWLYGGENTANIQKATDAEQKYVDELSRKKKLFAELAPLAMEYHNLSKEELKIAYDLKEMTEEELKSELDLLKSRAAAEKARIGTPLSAAEREQIAILSGTENIYAKKKRLIEEIRSAEFSAIHAVSEESRRGMIKEIADLKKELASVEKEIESKRKAAEAERKRLDHERFREIQIGLQQQYAARQEAESIEKNMIEAVKFDWSGYYSWKLKQIDEEYDHYRGLVNQNIEDEAKKREMLSAGEVFHLERMKELTRDYKEYQIRENKEWMEVWRDGLEDVRQSLSSAFTDFFDSFGDDTKSASDAFEDFGNSIIDSIQQTISEMMALRLMMMAFGKDFAKTGEVGGWFGSAIGAIGGAIGIGGGPTTATTGIASGRGMPTYQHGGVIDRPSIVVAGERGPEVILPLKRGSVRGEGARSGVTINAVIQTMDAQSFSSFADKHKGVFERQLLTSVAQNASVRRTLRKYM